MASVVVDNLLPAKLAREAIVELSPQHHKAARAAAAAIAIALRQQAKAARAPLALAAEIQCLIIFSMLTERLEHSTCKNTQLGMLVAIKMVVPVLVPMAPGTATPITFTVGARYATIARVIGPFADSISRKHGFQFGSGAALQIREHDLNRFNAKPSKDRLALNQSRFAISAGSRFPWQ